MASLQFSSAKAIVQLFLPTNSIHKPTPGDQSGCRALPPAGVNIEVCLSIYSLFSVKARDKRAFLKQGWNWDSGLCP